MNAIETRGISIIPVKGIKGTGIQHGVGGHCHQKPLCKRRGVYLTSVHEVHVTSMLPSPS